jgi:hypothetical protein
MTTAEASGFHGNEMVLAATAVRATVAKALRAGKTACHRPSFYCDLSQSGSAACEFPKQTPRQPQDDNTRLVKVAYFPLKSPRTKKSASH